MKLRKILTMPDYGEWEVILQQYLELPRPSTAEFPEFPRLNPFLSPDFYPTVTVQTLKHRAALIRQMRNTFDGAGFLEVETPLVSRDTVVDAWLDPFVTEYSADARMSSSGSPRYLQTSPEFAMKRLLVGGATAVYQIGKVFRNGEFGRLHNPEFTMAEWYRVGEDLSGLMRFTEGLVKSVFQCARGLSGEFDAAAREQFQGLAARVADARGFERLTYDAAFERYAGRSVLKATSLELCELAASKALTPPPGLAADDRDGWLNWLLAELVEPQLGRERPTFLSAYPASQAALARTRSAGPGEPELAERFELYLDGIELCNGYFELTDASVLRTRIAEQSALRAAAGFRPLPRESRLLDAMEYGLPAASGNALGVDRLVMLALGKSAIADVIPFPFDRA